MQMDEELPKHIEKFLDGEVNHYYESENNIPQRYLVQELTAENFETKIIQNSNVEQFLVEVYGKYCPACA